MIRELWLIIAAFAACGCGGPSTSAPAAPVPSLDVPRLDASAPEVKASAPKLDATCATNEECEAVFLGDDCCGTCAPRIGNKNWKRDMEAYCGKEEHRGKCEPMGCSWGYSKPQCEKGLCK